MSKGNRYRVLRGLNYPDPDNDGAEKRAEVGDVVDDLPPKSIAGLIEDGVIEPIEDKVAASARKGS